MIALIRLFSKLITVNQSKKCLCQNVKESHYFQVIFNVCILCEKVFLLFFSFSNRKRFNNQIFTLFPVWNVMKSTSLESTGKDFSYDIKIAIISSLYFQISSILFSIFNVLIHTVLSLLL